METLVLNGKTYVKASKAALDHGYTADYVGQLCRKGFIDSKLVGRTWYVDQTHLGEHRVEKRRSSRVKAREQVRKSILESQEKKLLLKSTNTYENIHISYKDDEHDLIPKVRKLDILSEKKPASITHTLDSDNSKDEAKYEVLNVGEKVFLSGKLKIQDASIDANDEDTTVLSPRIQRTKHSVSKEIETPQSKELTVDTSEEDDQEIAIEVSKPTFLDRLEQEKVILEDTDEVSETAIATSTVSEKYIRSEKIPDNTAHGGFVFSFVLFLILLILPASLSIVNTVTYHSSSKTEIASTTSEYAFTIKKIHEFAKELISRLGDIS